MEARRDMESLKQFIDRASSVPLEALEDSGAGDIRTMLVKELARTLAIPFAQLQWRRRPQGKGRSNAHAHQPTAEEWKIIGLARLLSMAHAIVAGSAAAEAKAFDAAPWLGEWVRRSQPALGGRSAFDLLHTREGVAVAERVLGAVESGAYQ